MMDKAWRRAFIGSSVRPRRPLVDRRRTLATCDRYRFLTCHEDDGRMSILGQINWTAVFVALLGPLSALAGVAMTQRATGRRDDARWERDRADRRREIRGELYVDLAEYVQSHQSMLDDLTDEYIEGRTRIPDLPHPDRLTARVRLHATEPVRHAWTEFLEAHGHTTWEAREGDVQITRHTIMLDPDNPAVVRLTAAIRSAQTALRAEIDADYPPDRRPAASPRRWRRASA
ncbi:hypothetical protein [Micromonospora sp. WMMD1082]|uniref:hypothetical protein n=1 Tax=Micromonospora sp. WMMD1082 TaxID=3016104 RepID=UPI002415AA6C|nr:hypothetical protein [Micromonospora sp. WMMD1082]MDG4795199.1 hypothetical protein [Micromonospora sp. WMMD1082]